MVILRGLKNATRDLVAPGGEMSRRRIDGLRGLRQQATPMICTEGYDGRKRVLRETPAGRCGRRGRI